MGITLNQLKAQVSGTTAKKKGLFGGFLDKAREAAKITSAAAPVVRESVAGSLPVTKRRFEKAQEENHKRDVVNTLIVMDMIEQLAAQGIHIDIDTEENLEARAEQFLDMLKNRQADEPVAEEAVEEVEVQEEEEELLPTDEDLQEYMTAEEEQPVQEETKKPGRRRLGKIGRQAPISDDAE